MTWLNITRFIMGLGLGAEIVVGILTIVLGSIYPFVHEPAVLLTVGFFLIVAIYVQVAILFGVYTPELFPTEVRLRANGICNTIRRAATIVSSCWRCSRLMVWPACWR